MATPAASLITIVSVAVSRRVRRSRFAAFFVSFTLPAREPAAVSCAEPVPILTWRRALMPSCFATFAGSLILGRTLDLAATAKRGLSAVGTCSEACTVDAQLSIDKRTARKLGVASARVVIGRAKVSLAAGERKTIRVKVAKKARRKLARAKRVRVQLALVVSDAAGNATTMKRTVTLRRLRKARAGVDARAGAAGPSLLLPGGELSLGLVNPGIGLGAAARK